MRTRIVVPARDEAASLPGLLDELASVWPLADVLIVDDASRDATVSVLARYAVPTLRLRLPLGIGGAMRAGLRASLRDGYDTVVRLDGDGQHPPSAIPILLSRLAAGADAVQASRGSAGYSGSPGRRALAAALGGLLGLTLGHAVSDPASGLWAFGERALAALVDQHPRGYPEPALHLVLARRGLRVDQVPVAMRPRRAGRSSLTVARGLGALWHVGLAMILAPLPEPGGARRA